MNDCQPVPRACLHYLRGFHDEGEQDETPVHVVELVVAGVDAAKPFPPE